MARMVALDLENRFQFARDAGTQPSEAMHPTGKVALPAISRASLGVTLSDAWQRYLSDPASSRSEKSALAYTTVRNLVVALIGADTQMDSVDRQDCRKVLETLRVLPRNYEKRWGEITPAAAATRAKHEKIDPMSISNANGYMQKFSSLFNWAVKEELVARNPCRGLRIADPVADRDRRLPFSTVQLEAIFTGSVYANVGEVARGQREVEHAARFYVPLIALFSGMRQNEICQLATNDIVILDGVPCFVIKADTAQGKRVKTAASQRIVPIHRALVSARLLDHWQRCRSGRELRLWPELRPDRFGYARVSSSGQSLDIQHEALVAAGCEKVFAEKMSGRSTKDRDQLAEALDFVRESDTLIITRLDRLARSVGDLHNIIERLTEKKVAFKCISQSGVDTDSSTGRLMLAILGAVAAFENDIRRERQLEGIAKAKLAGKYRGRPVSIDPVKVKALRADGMGPAAIARELKIGRASVYRALAA